MAENTTNTFDRMLGALEGLPDVVSVKPTTIRATLPLVGRAQTYIVQSFRQTDVGDTIFLEYVDDDGSKRIVLPPSVAAAIARQRDALTARLRRKVARAAAADRKARGVVPGFLRKKE